MISIIDSGIANIASVLNACRRLGVTAAVADAPAALFSSTALILPGVGAFADGMDSLRRRGLIEPIRASAAAGVPILGICLGMQLLAETSEEFGRHEGLGLIPGRVVRLEPAHAGERVPNIGWCDVTMSPSSRLFAGLPGGGAFYFMHSYRLQCEDEQDAAGTIAFGPSAVCAAVERGNVFGVQFHPEKSQDLGLRCLNNFMRLPALD
jgi:glutamine amidotransferase